MANTIAGSSADLEIATHKLREDPLSQQRFPKSSSTGIGCAPAYRMPAEWEPHQGTWVAWPHNRDTWDSGLEAVEKFYVTLVHQLAVHEEVYVAVSDDVIRRRASAKLGLDEATDRIQLFTIPNDDAWCRDYGPTIVCSCDENTMLPARLAVDWGFNAWGGKYPPWEQDRQAGRHMASALGIMSLCGSMVLEGGSIDTNGNGLLLTTKTCLMNPNRNPALPRMTIERKFEKLLGVRSIAWLDGELPGDDTDGHVDQLARFANADTIAVVAPGSARSSAYQALVTLVSQVEGFANKHSLNVVELPPPPPLKGDGSALPASYANFYVTNDVVFVPQFRTPDDDTACERLGRLFPNRRVFPIDCTAVIAGLGSVHCLTQQVPSASAAVCATGL